MYLLFHKELILPLHYKCVGRNLLGTIIWSMCNKDINKALLFGVRAGANTGLAYPCWQSFTLHHPRVTI